MEDILILLLQTVAQIIFEFMAYWPWDFWWYQEPFETDGRWSLGWWIVVAFILGALIGGLSLYIFPDVLIKWGWIRMVLLVASPLASGLMAKTLAERRRENNDQVDPWAHFWISLCFSVGLVWIRFTFAHRPV